MRSRCLLRPWLCFGRSLLRDSLGLRLLLIGALLLLEALLLVGLLLLLEALTLLTGILLLLQLLLWALLRVGGFLMVIVRGEALRVLLRGRLGGLLGL